MVKNNVMLTSLVPNNEKYMKTLCRYLTLVLTLFFVHNVSAQEGTYFCDLDSMLDNPRTTGLIYQIESPGKPPSYLFGSAHIGYKRFTKLPENVVSIIANSNHYYVEHLNEVIDEPVFDDFNFLPEGQTIATILKRSTYLRMRATLKSLGYTEDRLKNIDTRTPIFFVTLLQPQLPLLSNSRSLDNLATSVATENGLAIHSLENEQSVMSGFRQVSNEQWSDYLDALMDLKEDDTKRILNKQYHYCEFEAIRLGDVQQMEKDQLDAEELRPAQSKVMSLLSKSRNGHQATAVAEIVNKNFSVNFFSLGARHLVGSEGVVNRLRKMGFVVRQLQ